MTQIQGGAESDRGGNIQTKKALKEAVASDASTIFLYSTGLGGPQFNGLASQLPDDMEFLVVGPDPFKKRNWYATVKHGRDGKLTVN